MSLCSFTEKIEFNAPVEEVFKFFTDTDRMVELLPSGYRFRIVRRSARHLSQGVSLECEIRLTLIPIRWRSYVTSLSAGRHMTAVWQQGPLASVEHNSYFESLPNNQTRVTDCLLYQLPLGPLTLLADRLWIRPALKRLSEHRCRALLKIFRPAEKSSPSNLQPKGSPSSRNGSSSRSPKSKVRRQSSGNLILQKQV